MRWARETAGLDLDEAAAKLHLAAAGEASPAERLKRMEDGAESPTRAMIGTMAKHYRRPLVTFYLAAPPLSAPRGSDFRTLKDHDPRQDALVDALLRDIRARQATVRSTLELEEEAEHLAFVGSGRLEESASELAKKIESHLRFSLDEYRGKADAAKAFRYLRERTESTGVFVLVAGDLGSHHSEIEVDLFRGFAIADPIAPFIVINNRDSRAAWSFTLLHELVHVWLGQTGISGGAPDREVERFCDDVAGEILLRESELLQVPWPSGEDEDGVQRAVATFARARNVSSSMVAYKLYRAGGISRDLWFELQRRYRQLWLQTRQREREERQGESGGPDFYTRRRQRLGNALLAFASQMHMTGALSTTQAARLLGVAPRQLQPLLSGS